MTVENMAPWFEPGRQSPIPQNFGHISWADFWVENVGENFSPKVGTFYPVPQSLKICLNSWPIRKQESSQVSKI